ncbi:MAG: 16S rRNA (cytosine(1402)-N(4))-methyltransferase RsmH [Patescibacteria group bacterium]
MKYTHTTVFLKEAVDSLNLEKGDTVIDGTLGGGGHSLEMLKKITASGMLIGFDLDPEAIDECHKKFTDSGYKNFKLINDNFCSIYEHLRSMANLQEVRAILLDLGVSTNEIRYSGRGFSFQRPDEPLDLRMNPNNGITAADILNSYSEADIKKIIKDYGEEPKAQQIARRAVSFRKNKKFEIVSDLLQIIPGADKGRSGGRKIHPATKTWQALRIAVNDELANLEEILKTAFQILAPGGRLAIISFHSLEDRRVKQYFKYQSKDCICPSELPICQCHHDKQIKIITKKPIIPSIEEIKNNPQSRSAKLRVAEKI